MSKLCLSLIFRLSKTDPMIRATLLSLRALCIVFSIIIFFPVLSAQEIRQNERGEKIIVYPDGSWQYFSGFGTPESATDPVPVPATTPTNYPVFSGEIEPLEGSVSLTEADIFKIAVRRTQLAKDAAGIARKRLEEATASREKLEKELQAVPASNEEMRQQLSARLKTAKKMEQDARVEAQLAASEATTAEQLTQKGGYVEDFKATQSRRKSAQRAARQQQLASTGSYERGGMPLSDYYSASEDAAGDLIANPPRKPCLMAFEGKDEQTDQYRRDCQKQLLFTHTDERLRVFLKDKEYLRCEGYFTSLGGYRFITLQFTFAYPNAREAYGFIEEGSILTIKMLNGDFINLRAGRMDRGSYDTKREVLTYRVHYPIDRAQMNLLTQSEADLIRVFWSSGFEEYEVYQLDFFIHQIGCIEGKS